MNNPLHGDGTCFENVMAEQEFNSARGVSAFRTKIAHQGRSSGTSCPCGDLTTAEKRPAVNSDSSFGRSSTLTYRGKLACTETPWPRFRISGCFNTPSPPNKKRPARMSDIGTSGHFLRVGLCLSRLKAIQPSLARRGTAPGTGASQNAVRFGRISGCFNTPSPPNKKRPTRERFLFGGEGGIRTHVPGLPDHLISSQRRYGHFGTSPEFYCRRS